MAFRFLHTADIHLDAPLRSLALRDEALARRVGAASREAFERIVTLCLTERLDALVIAGDLFDGAVRSVKTSVFVGGQIKRLREAGVPVFLIGGNHDVDALAQGVDWPDNAHVFGDQGGMRHLKEAGVAVHGVSFPGKNCPSGLLKRFGAPVEGAANIALLHTSLGGAQGHDAYAPCSVAELSALGFDYWALGHIHKRAAHQGTGGARIVMPGAPQGRDVGEPGARSVTIVTMDGREVRLEERPSAILEFQRVEADASGAADWEGALLVLERRLEAARASAGAALVARLRVTGRPPLLWRLRRDADRLLEEARDLGQRLGGVWIESLFVHEAPGAESAGAEPSADPALELARLMRRAAQGPEPALARQAQSIMEQIERQLPAELRDAAFGASEEARAQALRELMEEGAAELAALICDDRGGLHADSAA